MAKRILFICTGNTCRSPMAEALMRRMAETAGLKTEVRSAGVFAVDGSPVSPQTLEVLKTRGIEWEGTSRPVTDELVEWADLILTMTMGHKSAVVERYPQAVEKTFTLKEFAGQNGETRQKRQEAEKWLSELQMKKALAAEPLTDEELRKAEELASCLADLDVEDPFGGSVGQYEQTARELERLLEKLIEILRAEAEE